MTTESYPHNDDVLMMQHLLSYPPHVLDALHLDPRPGVAIHISPVDTIEEFVPRDIQRTMQGEDELVPRICTGSDILGAIRGYAVTVRDFIRAKATNAGNDTWRGGYYIYAIPYQCSVLPGQTLCPMSRWVRERWLLPYRGEKMGYPATIVGKLFIHKLTKGSSIAGEIGVEFLVEVLDKPLQWDSLQPLEKGYHGLTIPGAASYFDGRFDSNLVTHRRITPTEYMQRKGLKAELLSYSPAASWGKINQ